MNASTSQPDNERIIEIVANADTTFREILTQMIEAKATPQTLNRVINSWEMLRFSINEPEEVRSIRVGESGARIAGVAVGSTGIGLAAGAYRRRQSDNEQQSNGAWVPESYTPEQVEAVQSYLREITNNPSVVYRSGERESIYTEEELDAMS